LPRRSLVAAPGIDIEGAAGGGARPVATMLGADDAAAAALAEYGHDPAAAARVATRPWPFGSSSTNSSGQRSTTRLS
jgi:hypothetical protein